ncbi:MAG: TadE/TadG family type IV pilus assembly protein, partial [Planctomycetota bacterium]
MSPKLKRPTQSSQRTGAAAVEMAVVSIVLFILIFGGIEMARVASLRHTADYAAYVGARRGLVPGVDVPTVKAEVEAHLSNLGVSGATITVTPSTITEDTPLVTVEVAIPAAGNSWVAPKHYSG